MRKLLFGLSYFCVFSCVTPESLFREISSIDFSDYMDFCMADYREGTLYIIDYQGNEYWGITSPNGHSFSKLRRKYTNQEIDSLSLKLGKDSLMKDIDPKGQLADDLMGFCELYRSIWGIDSRKLFLRSLFVDKNHNVVMTVLWKPTRSYYRVLITDNLKAVLENYDVFHEEYHDFYASFVPESLNIDDYNEIKPRLYYRIVYN